MFTVTSFKHPVYFTCMQTNYGNRFCQNLYTCYLQRHSCVFYPTELQRLHAVIQNSTTFTSSLNFHIPMRQRTAKYNKYTCLNGAWRHMAYENCPMLTSYRLVCLCFHSPIADTMNLRRLIPNPKFYRIHSRTVLFKLTHLT